MNISQRFMTEIERKTLLLHILFSFFNGAALGIVDSFREIVARKYFNASSGLITLLVMSLPMAWILSSTFIGYIQRHVNFRPFLIIGAVLRVVAMAFMFMVKTPIQYIICIWLFILPMGIINPIQNYILAMNYPDSRRGRWFGTAASVANFIGLGSSLVAGYFLDINQNLFRLIFFIVGISGAIACLILGIIPTPHREQHPFENPVKLVSRIFKKNNQFFHFEMNFFIYGSAFLLLLPVVPIYLVDVMNMSYKQISIARGVLGKLGIVIFSPFTGRFHDKHEPFTYAAMLFGLLALYPILLAVSSSLGLSVVYLAFLFFSFAMAGVLITWNIGSIYFAEPNREVAYQSVHLTMTGVRGIIAPVIGWMIMSFADFHTAFVVSAVIFIIAAYLMSRSGKKFKNEIPYVR